MMEPHVPAIAVVRIVARNPVEQRAHRNFQDVARAAGIKFEACAIRANAHDAATAKLQLAAVSSLRLGESKVADREIQPAIDPQSDSVRGVISRTILESPADVFHQHALFVRYA